MAYIFGCLLGGAAIVLLVALMAALGPLLGPVVWAGAVWMTTAATRALYRRLTLNQ